MASARTSKMGKRLPSTYTSVGFKRKASTALCMANIVACKIFKRSISSTLASAMAKHKALARISSNKRSRVLAVNFLESAKPLMGLRSSKMTAAATTGPARGPRPASSTPASKPGVSQARLTCSGVDKRLDRMGCQCRRVTQQGLVHGFKTTGQGLRFLGRTQPV